MFVNRPTVAAIVFVTLVLSTSCGGGSSPGSGGDLPTTGTPVYVSNLSSSVSSYVLDPSSGSLRRASGSPIVTGSSSSDAPSLALTANKKFLLASDIDSGGFSSHISVFSVDSTTAALKPVPGSPFTASAGIGTLVVHPNGKFAYGLSSSQILAFSLDPTTGALAPLGAFLVSRTPISSTLAISPNGQFMYMSSPVPSVSGFSPGITGFSIAPDGSLMLMRTIVMSEGLPGGLTFDSTGAFLFWVNGVNPGVSTFAVSATGALTEVGGSPAPVGMGPGDALFSRGFLYVLNQTSATISAFAFSSSTGQLTPLAGPLITTGTEPFSVATAASGRFLVVTTIVNGGGGTVAVFLIGTDGSLTSVAGSPFTPDTPSPTQVVAF